MFLCALSKAQTVNLRKATLFGGKADRASLYRRIQRFMASYNLCSSIMARLIVSLLPAKPSASANTTIASESLYDREQHSISW